jgi:hypothetical protein
VVAQLHRWYSWSTKRFIDGGTSNRHPKLVFIGRYNLAMGLCLSWALWLVDRMDSDVLWPWLSHDSVSKGLIHRGAGSQLSIVFGVLNLIVAGAPNWVWSIKSRRLWVASGVSIFWKVNNVHVIHNCFFLGILPTYLDGDWPCRKLNLKWLLSYNQSDLMRDWPIPSSTSRGGPVCRAANQRCQQHG